SSESHLRIYKCIYSDASPVRRGMDLRGLGHRSTLAGATKGATAFHCKRSQTTADTAKRARLEQLVTGPPHSDYLHSFCGLIVSTTWVLGLAFAVFTVVKRPVRALRPIFFIAPPVT